MATLVSPGVSVTVQNDAFYPASGPGTVPLVIFATAQDKLVPGSSSIVAEGTRKVNAGKMYLLTSQRDVLQTFGVPVFQEKNGTVVQGDELNEYGLHALFSAMGITNRAYALRADIDLNALSPRGTMPTNEPLNQTIWLDLSNTDFGVFEHNGGTAQNKILNWTKKPVLVPAVEQVSVAGAPISSFGNLGDYAFVPYAINGSAQPSSSISARDSRLAHNRLYKKDATGWAQVTNISYTTLTPPSSAAAGAVWVRMDPAAGGLALSVKKYNSAVHAWQDQQVSSSYRFVDVEAKLRNPLIGSIAYMMGAEVGEMMIRNTSNALSLNLTNVTAAPFVNANVQIVYVDGKNPTPAVSIYRAATVSVVDLINTINNTGVLKAVQSGTAGISVTSPRGTAFEIIAGNTTFRPSTSNWYQMVYEASILAPTRDAAEGTVWYDNNLYVDMMINDGQRWRGLRSAAANSFGLTNTTIAFFAQAEPTVRPNLANLAYGDVWIDPNDGTNFDFYVYQSAARGWMKLDATDQSTPMGILFADARASTETGVSYFTGDTATARDALLASDYVDADCPDPRLYPAGMLMVNMRQTGGVVRKYVEDAFANINFFDGADADVEKYEYYVGDQLAYLAGSVYTPLSLASVNGSRRGRWVTASGLASDGSGLFGRSAQRKVIVESMAATIIGNDELRAETIEFNLMTAPGYMDLLDEMVTLNLDRKETAYIITDVPARLAPDATSINNWAKNVYNAPSNGERGRITRYDYAAQYMGWGLGTNADGKEVVVPGSTIALRTYLYSDSVSYVWFPPAGIERGIVTNAASIGYVNAEGEYASVIYNQGQRDTMYLNNINPIALRPNRGLLVFGDKSLSNGDSALDRVNVGRLIVYIRTEVAKIAERFIFKLNTPRVREEFAGALTAFLANIVQLEGLEDFLVVCDSSNNTPVRVNRNELWADIAIVPTKSINFVYVPIRLRNQSA